MRRLINDPYEVVEEMLSGYVKAHKDQVKLLDHDGRVLVKKDLVKDKVGVIIGGGSGHEPLFLGYVGENFADAAV
ncbi:MAG: dihydroxyacetone kinase, partial [Clostridium sp.]|nr:dihydroxyacetone kinase [Clostridium sp.]